MSDDKVFELYEGSHGNPDSREDLLDRLEWIFSRITAGPVLDVGCSQGLLPILLARRGIAVKGIDINGEAIAYADAKRVIEPPSVQARLAFEHTQVESVQDVYEFVILGEVLEHVPDPRSLLRSSLSKVKVGGKVLVQVPFGLFPHPDHFTTFYAGSFAAIVPQDWAVTRLEMRGRRLCAQLERGRPALGMQDLISFDERYFLEKEQAYAAKIRRLGEEYNKCRQQVFRSRHAYESLRASVLRPWHWPRLCWRFIRKLVAR